MGTMMTVAMMMINVKRRGTQCRKMNLRNLSFDRRAMRGDEERAITYENVFSFSSFEEANSSCEATLRFIGEEETSFVSDETISAKLFSLSHLLFVSFRFVRPFHWSIDGGDGERFQIIAFHRSVDDG